MIIFKSSRLIKKKKSFKKNNYKVPKVTNKHWHQNYFAKINETINPSKATIYANHQEVTGLIHKEHYE